MNEAAWQDLARIKAPTLVIRGAESNILSRQTATKMSQTLATSQLVEVPKAGHLVQGDNPEEFERVVRQYLGV